MSNTDERQPLLPPPALAGTSGLEDVKGDPPVYTASDVENQNPSSSALGEQAEEQEVEEVKEKRSWWSIAWYTVLWGLGTFFAVLFIKGFIDADDVEVCI